MLGFIDHYPHIKSNLASLNINRLNKLEIEEMAVSFLHTNPLPISLDTCTVKVDLSHLGIPTGMCVDKKLIEKIIGYKIAAKKDSNQRDVCSCIESIDIGTYASCSHDCIYCYAIRNKGELKKNIKFHDKLSPMLIGNITGYEMITERQVKSLKTNQQSLF